MDELKQEIGIRHYITIALKRRWILIVSVAVSFVLLIGFLLFQPAVYQSGAMLMIELQSSDMSTYSRYRLRQPTMFQTEDAKPLEYYQSVLNSQALRSELMRRLTHDDSLWAYLPIRKSELPRIAQNPISLIPSPGYEDFVMLTVSSNNPHLSYRLANLATNLLKEQCQTLDREELQNAVNFIEQQKEASRRNLDDAERTLQEFKKKTSLTTGQESGGALQILSNMEIKLSAIETEKQFAAANLAAYTRRLAQMESSGTTKSAGIESPYATRFKADIAKLESQRAELASLNRKDDPALTEIDTKIEEKKRGMIAQLVKSSRPEGDSGADLGITLWKEVYERKLSEELNHFVLENRERYYKNLIEDFKRKNPNLMENAIELMRLERSQTVSENLYTFLLQQGEEAKIKAAAGTGGIRIIDMPVLPAKPIPVDVKRKLTMFLILGLGMGIGIIILLETLDHSIRSPEDVDTFLKLPTMGQIPVFPMVNGLSKTLNTKNFIKTWIRNHPQWNPKKHEQKGESESHPERFNISQLKPKDPVVEAYRTLRSNLQFASIDQPIKTLLVSSPNPGEGKTMTAANLGIAFALLGTSVCVVDADLRKPKQHTMFKIKQSPGLTECLVESLSVSKVIQKSGVDNLSVLTSGKTPPNPAEVLGSKKMQEVIAELSKQFDCTIFDSPPVLAVTDAVLLASRLDGVLLVVKNESTNRFFAADVVNSLRKANGKIYGVVVNQIARRKGYGYYYYYSEKKYY